MNEMRLKPYIRVVLVVVVLCIAGAIGYDIGSRRMNGKWVGASQKSVPIVIDYVMGRYEEAPRIDESTKELIRAEGLLLFIQGTWMQIDPKGYSEYLEHIEEFGDR
jgi:hypothetical protein